MVRAAPQEHLEGGGTEPEWRRTSFRRAAAVLLAPAAVLSLLSGALYASIGLSAPGESETTRFWFYFFDVGREINVPTWFSAGLWLAAAALAGCFARRASRRRRSWALFATVCVLLSLDETLELHERLDVLGAAMSDHLPVTSGFTWVVPGALVTLVLVASLSRLVLGLPRGPRRGLLLSGAVFVTGALGVESLSGRYVGGPALPWEFFALTLVEETLEMTGVALAVASLLHVLAHRKTGTNSTEYRVADREEPLTPAGATDPESWSRLSESNRRPSHDE